MLIACKCVNLIAITSRSNSNFSSSGGGTDNQNEFRRDKSENNLTVDSSGNGSDIIQYGVNLMGLRKLEDTSKIYTECLGFFKQPIEPLYDLTETIAQTSLIYEVPIWPWTLYYCINCNTVTHAKHTSEGRYLINSTLLTNHEEINSVKERKSYSKIFGLIIMNKQTAPRTKQSSEDANSSSKFKPEIKKLTQHLNNHLQREIYETEERIRSYSEQQFALLKNYREKAEQEYQILVSLVNQVPEQLKVIETINNLATPTTETDTTIDTTNITNIDNGKSLFTLKHQQFPSLDTPPATPDSTPMSIGNSPTFRNQSNIFGALSSVRNSLNSGPKTLDGDLLFELEDMETYPISTSNAMSDLEEAEDAEDALGELGSAIQIPKAQTKKQNIILARSLPINIAPIAEMRFVPDEAEDELSDDNNVDIAASIKALAKSVHGDTVFGDLPRPRFSTQI